MSAVRTRTDISSNSTSGRHEVGDLLQATITELLDLTLLARQLRWTVDNDRFGKCLDDLTHSWQTLADAEGVSKVWSAKL